MVAPTGAVGARGGCVSMSSHQSPVPASTTYLTPPAWLQALGPFDLDPCAAPSPRPWPTAARHIELPEDGLAAEWSGRVWCNPPFGREADAWAAKMAAHGNGILLLPARTETQTWFRHVWPCATAVLFAEGRPHFHAGFDTSVLHNGRQISVARGEAFPFNSGCPIALIAYGERSAEALHAAGLGVVVRVAA